MKKLYRAGFTTIISICLMILTGCGSPEKIDSFKRASYDEYTNTTSKEYSNWSSIYITGTLKNTEVMKIDDIDYLVANVEEAKDKNWICIIGQAGVYSDEILGDYIGKKLRFFGEYQSPIENKQVMKFYNTSKYCIKTTNDKVVADPTGLMASREYATNWIDKNGIESRYDVIKDLSDKIPGVYVSRGLCILDGNDNLFKFVQKGEDGLYHDCYVSYDCEHDDGTISEAGIQTGEGISIYYYVNENGFLKNLFFSKYSGVGFNLDDFENQTEKEIILTKDYQWKEEGNVKLSAYYPSRQDKSNYAFDVVIDASTEKDAISATNLFLNFFDKLKLEESSLVVKIHGTNANIIYYRTPKITIITGEEYDGTVVDTIPSWLDLEKVNQEEYTDIISGLSSIMNDFLDNL